MKKSKIKAIKKIYSVDTGIANAVSFKFLEEKGRMLENAVFPEQVGVKFIKNLF